MRASAMAAALLIPCALIAGCKKQPDFDAQYDQTAQEIAARAKKLDAEMNQKMQAMDREMEVRGFATPAPAPAPTGPVAAPSNAPPL